MQWTLIVLVIASGCGFRSSAAGADAAPPGDAATDTATAPLPDAQSGFCIGRFVVVCRPTAPTTNENLALTKPATVDTDTDPRCVMQGQGTGAPTLCVIAGYDIKVDAAITVIGSHPLVLAAYRDLNITMKSTLSVTSPRGGMPGAGANDPACSTPTAGGNSMSGGGGGAGGSFGGAGGTGGTGGTGSSTAGVAGTPITAIARVIGGCKGSPGGPAGAVPGGAPGNGGGAVMLIAARKLTLDGVVTAGGGGGGPLAVLSGGGGGGSGGFVGLDAMTYAMIKGRVTANGGGGASGGTTIMPGRGGQDGTASTTVAASGGVTPPDGDGGNGSLAPQPGGTAGQSSTNGGGGGGGGAGVILVKGTAPTDGSYSPPLTIVP